MTVNGINQTDIKANTARKHPTYWFDDGSLILQVEDVAYNLHKTILTRHSPLLQSLTRNTEDGYKVSVVQIPEELGVTGEDFDKLLEHLYHDMYLNFPNVHKLARERIISLLPRSLEGLSHPEFADQALTLAVRYELYPIQKALFYTVSTHMHFEEHDGEGDANIEAPSQAEAAPSVHVPPDVLQRCKDLLDQLIAHFTPILFTVATAGHMACTDVLAETWMPLVIQPALENNGLCRPIETLQAIIDLDWGTHGLCQECVAEKVEEWKGEQAVVWNKMDEWLGMQKKE
ncbi:hypothetical protein EIP91_007279 [Steccherinum ochraceum]|uniref:BTB domain-containing protein n=1 Tax=Steccherinum ochraceum TaxID=92696 RepID=A0A4R0R4D5_9APHY|nr:hypothetical protein EIP91_007279 [Steccherinum ochraceum]